MPQRSVPDSDLWRVPQAGIRVSNASLGGFQESGSELALDVHRISHTFPSFVADLEIAPDPRPWRDWVIVPSLDLGCEVALGGPRVESSGELYGFTVSQASAYDSWCLMKTGVAVTAQCGTCTVTAAVKALFGNEASTGFLPQLSIGYGF